MIPLSIDWEDWFQLCCDPFDAPDALDRFECRLPLATEKTLSLCGELGATGTWFCLVDQALRHPGLVREIRDQGHRIGLHGVTHRRIFQQDRAAFRRDLERGKKTLEDLLGVPVLGFRAPEWSLRGTAEDYWQDVMEAGFRYDASRAPLVAMGSITWPRESHQLREGFWECPPPVAGVHWARVPLWGWGMRVLPESWLRRRMLRLAERRSGNPIVLHPWELDEEQPELPGCGWAHHFVHYAGIRGYRERLMRLLSGIRTTSLEAFLGFEA